MFVNGDGLELGSTTFPVKENFNALGTREMQIENVFVNSVGEIVNERDIQRDAVAIRRYARVSANGRMFLKYEHGRRVSFHDEQFRFCHLRKKTFHYKI